MHENDPNYEAALDRRVQSRLRTDRDYLFAENAEDQSWAERKIELQEEIALLEAGARLSADQTLFVNALRGELREHLVEQPPAR